MTTGIEFVHPDAQQGGAPHAHAAFTVAGGDVAGRARQVSANPVTALEGGGAGPGEGLKRTVYVATADRSRLAAAGEVVREAFGDHDAPSTLAGVTLLGRSDQPAEVEAVAVRDSWEEPAPPHHGPTRSQ
ncbi:MAG: enamine deaminase RidA [Blastococcus sp.]|nr:enamine deaminase RidA [Blastococcus sp.]